MRIAKITPEILSVPSVIDEAGLNVLLSSLGYGSISTEKATVLINHLSGIIYRVTGQFFNEATLTIQFDNPNADDVLYTPFRVVSLTSIKLGGVEKSLSDFRILPDRIMTDKYVFPSSDYGDVEISGVFGYASGSDLPSDISWALQVLLEDMTFGDKFDRMMSNAESITMDKLTIDRKNTSLGELSGNEEVDRILKPFIWTHSPIVKKNMSGIDRTYSVL